MTANPKEHILRAKILLNSNNNALLLYSALELRLAIEGIIHNQYSSSPLQSKGSKKNNDPKRKKILMNTIEPMSDKECEIYYIDPYNKKKIFWGKYKSIPTKKVNTIEGKLGNLLHIKSDVNIGIENDRWYIETRTFLNETINYLNERTSNSEIFFSYSDIDNFVVQDV